MWICLNDGFFSIVKSPNPGKLLVRARRKGDIERVFGAEEIIGAGTDYLSRAHIDKEIVLAVMAGRIERIDYPNFKNSVKNRALHDAYMDVWDALYRLQSGKRAWGGLGK